MGNKLQSPCLKCGDRTVGCHSTCERYLDYRSNVDDYNNKVKEARYKEEALYYHRVEMCKKARKHKSSKWN